MELKEAKSIIITAIDMGVKAGIYDLGNVEAILAALKKVNEMPDVEFGDITPVEND
jgi:hypothetical protein